MNDLKPLILPVVAMVVIIVAANVLVQYPVRLWGLDEWLTFGAFTYPITFLVTDLTNRSLGAGPTRRVVYIGFAVAVVLSAILATPRIAIASGSAFFVAQLLDVAVFDRLRRGVWWRAPLVSSFVGSAVDTALFFSIAFAFTPVPWVTLALGDFVVKMALALAMLIPFGMLLRYVRPLQAAQPGSA